MRPHTRSLGLFVLSVTALATAGLAGPAAAAPEGQMTWAIHVTLAPKWLDPGETEAVVTPFMLLYPLHDALVKLGARRHDLEPGRVRCLAGPMMR